MATQAPIFEQSTSALYYSNDARLHLARERGEQGVEYSVIRVPDKPVVEIDENGVPVGEEVFRTFDRVKADAYIAGYDLATECR